MPLSHSRLPFHRLGRIIDGTVLVYLLLHLRNGMKKSPEVNLWSRSGCSHLMAASS